MLPLSLHDVAQRAVDPLLEVEGRHDVGVGLANQEVVDVEHLAQAAHGQVLLQAAVPPPPLRLLHRLRIEPARTCLFEGRFSEVHAAELCLSAHSRCGAWTSPGVGALSAREWRKVWR